MWWWSMPSITTTSFTFISKSSFLRKYLITLHNMYVLIIYLFMITMNSWIPLFKKVNRLHYVTLLLYFDAPIVLNFTTVNPLKLYFVYAYIIIWIFSLLSSIRYSKLILCFTYLIQASDISSKSCISISEDLYSENKICVLCGISLLLGTFKRQSKDVISLYWYLQLQSTHTVLDFLCSIIIYLFFHSKDSNSPSIIKYTFTYLLNPIIYFLKNPFRMSV